MEVCPSCGAPIPGDATACAECGAPVPGSTAAFEAVAEDAVGSLPADLAGAEVPVLVVGKGAEVGERFYLEQPEITIGRDSGSGIFLNDVTVSRHHARLLLNHGVVTIEDSGSLNGTYVNDRLVDSAVLRSGDSVQIGRFRMVFLAGGA